MSNKAKDILIPEKGVFRTVFLYVGQGDATLFVIPEGDAFKYVLMDTNADKKNGGIDLGKMLSDLMDEGDDLVFINTHPHNDHLKGVKDIHEAVKIAEVWHSGHNPGKDHDEAYQEMKSIIRDIGEENEFVMFGTNDENKLRKSDKETEVENKLGDIDYVVLSPAEYVQDDVDEENAEGRYSRIHERCAVMKLSYGGDDCKHVMMTGDSDKKAWKEHITEYHEDKLQCDILSASHHGSRTFFKETEEDKEVYEDHVKAMEPDHVVVSAPKQSESKHDHPHDDAMDLYKKHVEEDNLYHLGRNRECVIVDIGKDGNLEVKFDQELVAGYGYDSDDDGSKSEKALPFVGSQTSRLDHEPMG